jgi:hypothetical protein
MISGKQRRLASVAASFAKGSTSCQTLDASTAAEEATARAA